MSEPEHPPAGATAWSGAATPDAAPPEHTSPDYAAGPVAFRGPESLGGLLLVLAGIAAAISLLLDWLNGRDVSGWSLVRQGLENLGDAFGNGLWQPVTIVLGGGVLFLLGLLLWLPARTHRLLGVLGLLVSLAVTTAVLVPLMDESWDLDVFGIGFWFGCAVAVLGLLGSLKAILTGPKYGTR
jgi:hypothetical protein